MQTYYLPPRNASLPENYEVPDSQQVALHSPFSPLSPSCSLYPDGIIGAPWIQKHQEIVPSVFLCCYSLTPDSTTATLQDNKIKSDITAFRTAVQQSGYRSRVAVAIFVAAAAGEDHAAADGLVQERLESIRKTTGTETKLFFAVPATSELHEELHRVAENMLVNIYAVAMDYYRELGRHARKKRGRGSAPQPSVPPTSGTSQTLSLAGWHIRYDVKTAVLTEFRQETDVALRIFDQAYEILLGPEVLYEAIPHWSPRWNEARLLADTLAIRSLRCLLIMGQHSLAVRRWTMHRDRLFALLNARGRGTANYGWKAWEARWAAVMADLVQRVGVPDLAVSPSKRSSVLYLQPEKTMVSERPGPFEFMHHRGYWFRMAARQTAARRALAQAIPEDDRHPPDFSPASAVAHRAFTYDDYMCQPPHKENPLPSLVSSRGPGVNHSAIIVRYLEQAITEFVQRRQKRTAAELALECGREYVGAKQWQAAIDILAPLWTAEAWAAWPNVREELGWTLRAAAQSIEPPRTDLLVAVDWELQSTKYTRKTNWPYDVGKIKAGEGAEVAKVKLESAPSFLLAGFVFRHGEGKAGEVAQAQFALRSNAQAQSAPIVFDELRLRFSGSLKPMIIKHAASGKPRQAISIMKVALEEEEDDADEDDDDDDEEEEELSNLVGSADLTLYPQSTLVFELSVPLRRSGDARALAADFRYSSSSYALVFTSPLVSDIGAGKPTWFLAPRLNARTTVPRTESQAIHILPRPPKLDIRWAAEGAVDKAEDDEPKPHQLPAYYTNEAIELALELVNREEADANVKVDVLMEGDDGAPGFTLLVGGDEIDTAPGTSTDDEDDAQVAPSLKSVPLGRLATGASTNLVLRLPPSALPTNLDITLRAVYHLASAPGTPISQQLVFRLALGNPFEANYDLLPRVHPTPWPSLFDHEGIQPATPPDNDAVAAAAAHGLVQAWALVTRYASFATEDLRVVDLDLVVEPVPGVAVTHARQHEPKQHGAQLVKPQTMEEAQFDLMVQKQSLDDRDAVHLDVSFVISWQRLGASQASAPNRTVLPVPRLALFGSEPRVLASVAHSRQQPTSTQVVTMTVAIENPSAHFLTFGLTMEPSNEFAFSGAKMTTLHVLPMSRRTVTYRLMPTLGSASEDGSAADAARERWIRPGLVVRDKYFQKVLRILPTEGMKMDKEGILIWVPPVEEEDDEDDEEDEEEDEDDEEE